MTFSDSGDKIIFNLIFATKTYNVNTINNTDLQKLKVRGFPHMKKLCPITAISDYIHQTRTVQKGEDLLFVLMGTLKTRPTSRQSILRWIREVLAHSGLKDFWVHSTRTAAATNTLLLGLSLDTIMAKTGWQHPSTFVKHYMKLLTSLIAGKVTSMGTSTQLAAVTTSTQPTADASENPKSTFSVLWKTDHKLKPKKTDRTKLRDFKKNQLARKKIKEIQHDFKTTIEDKQVQQETLLISNDNPVLDIPTTDISLGDHSNQSSGDNLAQEQAPNGPQSATTEILSGYHADTPITIKAEPSIWPTAAFINIHEHPI